ncbi:inorganic phosphate transporter [Candidatus Gracilibacteria bacterium]|jgi:PiT family inorganic phosphate transporter|nr:inorganic phosphate transporter [Candidatus Gracilibacteria bacterium]
MDLQLIFVGVVITLALIFDFTNGFHDAANSIATIVSTRVLTPRQAVVWAAFFNFVAIFVFGTAVAKAVGKGLIDIDVVTTTVVFAGLIGTVTWNILTWYWGLPTSSSHALIGGYTGAAIAKAGFSAVLLSGWSKTILFIFLAPIIGMTLGYVLLKVTTFIVYKKTPAVINKWTRRLQLVSAALYSLGHGGNDAQKTMGIITSVLFAAGLISAFEVPVWVAFAANGMIALGTLFGGWRIVKTMGDKITKLRPIDGFCAETSSAASLFLASHLGVPVSTTHVITSAITGVGAAKKRSSVRWDLMGKIFVAWIVTIPLSGIMAFIAYKITTLITNLT